MAWEDRTPAEQAQADQDAAAYRERDDDLDHLVVTDKGTRIRVSGINSARAVAERDGTIHPIKDRKMTKELIRDVTDLPEGTRIPTGDPKIGVLTVLDTLFDSDPSDPVGCVEVDVTCDPTADIWDLDALANAVGASTAWWQANTPERRYRLYFPANRTVRTVDDGR